MADVQIEIDDIDVRRMLTNAPRQIDRAQRLAMSDATKHILKQMRTYPPPPGAIQGPASVPVRRFATRGGQRATVPSRSGTGKGVEWARAKDLRYKRTGTLRRSWSDTVRKVGVGYEGRVTSNGNAAPYNRYVQDADRQAGVHRGRWDTAQEVARRSRDDINRMFQNRLAAELR